MKSLLLALVLVVPVFAQAPLQEGAAPMPPMPDELDKSYLDQVQIAATAATAACQQLESMKQYLAVRDRAVKRIEARHPGYTVDVEKGLIVAKPQPQPLRK